MKNWIITSIFLLCINLVFSQDFPEGISYQAQVHNSDGGFLSDATIGVEFSIRASAMDGEIVWQERHISTTNELGHFSTVIGQGTTTGEGSTPTFDAIDWAGSTFFLEMAIDEDNSGDFVSSMVQQMMAVPFAFASKTTSQEFALSELLDVDTAGIEVGDILKWDGANWVPEENVVPDTVTFAYYTDSTLYADTAAYALNCGVPELVDSASYAYHADTANYALLGVNALYADTAIYSDTAGVANFAYNNWGISGNDNIDAAEHFLGTTDSVDLVLKSFNTERMRVKANGLIGIGTDEPLADFHVNNTNGVLYTGSFGTGSIPAEGSGIRMMWYPRKAAFRSGRVTGTQWNDGLIGEYSFGAGYNVRATQDYSIAFGFNTQATGEGAMAVGNASIASGDYSFAAGHNPQATGDNSIALGRGAIATGGSAIAIGYHPSATADFALSLGNYTLANAESSVAIGYHARAMHEGSFIFNDKADDFDFIETTAANQFMVKASGGTIFYSDEDLTTGVELLPGAGAWSILSDRDKKENIKSVDAQDYLNRIDNVPVYSWSYIAQDSSIQHIGPMAQDFFAAFELGKDSTSINSGDFDGINLLLIKALDEKFRLLEDQDENLEELKIELAELREQRKKLMEMLLKLERDLKTDKLAANTSEE